MSYAEEPAREYGVSVFGKVLGIHEHSALAISGDLYLEGAEITGSGTLLLTDKKVQRIRASHSTVSKLEINNPTRVLLHGELHIYHKLIVKHGVMDSSNALLTLADSSTVALLQGGSLLDSIHYRTAEVPLSSTKVRNWPVPLTEQLADLLKPHISIFDCITFCPFDTSLSEPTYSEVFSPPEQCPVRYHRL
ncbi:hypothetical protein DSL64_26720 [Dyadobacter luteus]|uniref:Uncharacterized protein n=1 Tax=Dyadobacter luteus TaxID=2259619 RepID=A0A3D8Y373_9BACT|nr:hypothetical protein DSL64_26720 [Dyadobacter luteus]